MAGTEGFEPTLAVLETDALPLNYIPMVPKDRIELPLMVYKTTVISVILFRQMAHFKRFELLLSGS